MNFSKEIKTAVLSVLVLLSIGYSEGSFAQTANTNYVRTRTPRVPVTDALQLDTIPVQRQTVGIAYSDGLGRGLQSVQMQGSPKLNDIVVPYVYDNMGRSVKAYLPYSDQGTSSGNAGTYRSGATTNVLNFYNPASPGAPKIPTDAAPYAQTVYEASPLGRVMEQGAVGTVYQPGTTHTVQASYQVNLAEDFIQYYQVNPDLSATAYDFAQGTLTRTFVTDENGHRWIVWKDLQDRIVSRDSYDNFPLTMTDYSYNDLGQLSNILTPLGRNDFDFAKESYVFRYDSIGRVVEKLVPGKGWEYMVYNHSDKLVLSQDSNMRNKNQWIYLKYDAEGRMVQTGIYTNATVTGRKAMQYLIDTSYPTLWETWQPGTGYTNNAFPTASTNLYTTYYYDDYSFSEAGSKPFQTNTYGTTPTARTMGMLTGASVYVLGSSGQYLATVNYYDNQNRLIQQLGDNHLGFVDVVNNQYDFTGELTGSEQKTTPLTDSLVTVKNRYVYDPMGRLLDTYTSFQGGAEVDISHNIYNEVDQKVSEMLSFKGNKGFDPDIATAADITENTTLTSSKTDIASNSVTLSPNFHFTASSGVSYRAAIGYTAAQRQEFRYNIRGWLTNINNGTLTNDGITQSDPNALFGETIYYDLPDLSGATAQYNGNISGITWRNKIEASGKPGVTTGGQGFSFDYDVLNRHTGNTYFTQSGSSFTEATGVFNENTGYDVMGNLQEIYRTDKTGTNINDQIYNYRYHSNLLDSLADYGINNIGGSFTYDGNGNMTGDSHKGITISYNYLDLPDTVSKGSSKLVFTYDAAGNKLYKQLIVSGTVTDQRHYVENLEVTATSSLATDGRIDFALMDEGRIVHTDSGYRYEYWLTDHLGNNRVSFRTRSNGSVQLSQVQNYYPFGSEMGDSTMNYSISPHNHYRYSDKEFQHELDLDTYDFGARHYDAVLGRWMGIDPMAIISDDQSPFSYAGNNPLNMIDPNGMQASSPDFTYGSSSSWITNDVGSVAKSGVSTGNGGLNVAGGLLRGANAIRQIIAAKDAFNINKPVLKQDWVKNTRSVQGTPINPRDQPNIGPTSYMPDAVKDRQTVLTLEAEQQKQLGPVNYQDLGSPYTSRAIVDNAIDAFSLVSGGVSIYELKAAISAWSATKEAGRIYRYMSSAELKAIQETGILRGGRAGETYFTKDVYTSAAKAQSRLALESLPEYRVEFQILNDPKLIRNGAKVLKTLKGAGKGSEFMTLDKVVVKLINWQPIK